MPAVECLSEVDRNRLLRRADWRFLRLGPPPARSLCLAGGQLGQAVALISAQVVGREGPLRADCDLAVAANPTAHDHRTARAALRPGGLYYTEWYSPLAGGPPGIRRALSAAGFTDIACYWPWPWPNRAAPLFWLPAEAPGALAHFLASRPAAGTLWQRLRRRLLHGLWQAGRRARWLVPLCVVVQAPGGQGTWLEALRARWPALGLGPSPAALNWLLLSGGRHSANKLVGLVFAGEAAAPSLVVKLPRLPAAGAALAREAAALRAVQAARPAGLPGVPRLIFFDERADPPALGETVIAGQPLYTRLRRSNYRALALQVTDWLLALAASSEPRPRAEWAARLLDRPLQNFAAAYAPVLDPRLVAHGRARLARLDDLPLVIEQRDCSPWNVLLGPQGELGVVDWESAEPRGLPLLDLHYFLTYLAFFVDGAMETGRFEDAYRAARSPATFTGRVVAECQQRYAACLGLNPASVGALRLLAWSLHACSEYERLAAAGTPSPETLRSGLFLRLWREELRLLGGDDVPRP